MAKKSTTNKAREAFFGDAPEEKPVGKPIKGAITPIPHEATPIPENQYPRKHAPGALKSGDSVWYRGERWWVESAPPSWDKGCHVRISNRPIHPGADRTPPNDRETFCVHADVLDLAPTVGNIYSRQPTMSAVETKERMKAEGVRDIGDEVALLLRPAETLDDVYRIAAKYLGVPEDELRAKYKHLNNGQQRMNLGNRMRGHMKKGGNK